MNVPPGKTPGQPPAPAQPAAPGGYPPPAPGYPTAGQPAYAPPPSGASGPRAGWWQRFGAYLLDSIIVGIPFAILYVALKGPGYALGLLLSIAYFIYFEGGATGQTLGKRALNIRVIDFRTGGPIGYPRAFLRWIGRILDVLVIGIPIGYLWAAWDREKQAWHDKVATTVVVPTSAYPVPTAGGGSSASTAFGG